MKGSTSKEIPKMAPVSIHEVDCLYKISSY